MVHVIAMLGLLGVLRHPQVITAVDPRHGIGFLVHTDWSFVVLGGVFLAMTGGEALYADMGHIGRNPIRTSWYVIVLPALLLNYAGQVALFLAEPGDGRQSIFQAGAIMVDLSASGACHLCHDHRQPSDHHRIVFADPSGDAARLVPGCSDPPDLFRGIWTDLRAVRELDDDGRTVAVTVGSAIRSVWPAPMAPRFRPPCC